MKHFNTIDDLVLDTFKKIAGNANAEHESKRVIDLYLKPARYYHTINHVWDMITAMDDITSNTDTSLDYSRLLAIKVATIFHDVIYDCKWSEDESVEMASAKVWKSVASKLDVVISPELVEYITALIIATQNHIPCDDHEETLAFLDADLSILGASPEVYLEYAKNIRQEWIHIPDSAYRAGRLGFLTKTLEKTCIFYTRYAKEKWESAARDNMMFELKLLDPSFVLERNRDRKPNQDSV